MKGGRQPGAGRPKGTLNKPRLLDYWTPEEIVQFATDLKAKAKTDPNIMKFVAEQLFGKPVQPVGNEDGKPFIVQFDSALKHEFSSAPKEDSGQ